MFVRYAGSRLAPLAIASAALAGMLPGLVDKLSPDGKLPDAKGIESMVGQFLCRH